MQHGRLPGVFGVGERNILLVVVDSVSIALAKIDRYFNLLARFETAGLDVYLDSVVASLPDGSDTVEDIRTVTHDLILPGS
jgi:hypothetical protein